MGGFEGVEVEEFGNWEWVDGSVGAVQVLSRVCG